MSMDSVRELFASSLLTQSLIRNGFDVRRVDGQGDQPDLLVIDRHGKKRFGIDVKWASSRSGVKRLGDIHSKLAKGTRIYKVVVIGSGANVLASKELIKKIKIRDPSVHMEPLEAERRSGP